MSSFSLTLVLPSLSVSISTPLSMIFTVALPPRALKSYGESALILDVAHWCKYLDYSKYLACIEEINFEIKRRFEDEGIEMAYPTQTVHLVNKEASRD